MFNNNNFLMDLKRFSNDLNNITFTDYYYRLMLLARSLYTYKNLPNNIQGKWIERYLFNEGKCVFFNDKEKGFMTTKVIDSGELNPYDESTTLTAYATGMDNVELVNNNNCVLIGNNDEFIPTSLTIQLYASRLAELTRTADININAQKTPVIILCDEKQRMTMKNVYKQWNGFEPVIYGDKNLGVDGIKVLKTDAPIVFDKLRLEKHSVWNECMTFLGINNANQDKKERLVDDEVQANNEQVHASANVMLKARKEAIEKINNMFDLNISVEFNETVKPVLEELEGGMKNVC